MSRIGAKLSLRNWSPFPAVLPEERSRLLYACIAFMCAAAAGIAVRTAAATLFLSAYEPSRIAYMYVFGAILLTGTALLVGRMLDRMSPSKVAIAAGVIGAFTAVGLRLLASSGWRPMAAVIYLASEVLARLPVLLFWGVAALIFNAREGKRLFVLVGAGGTLACALVGAGIRPFAKAFTTADLLFVVAGLLTCFAIAIARLTAVDGGRSAVPGQREPKAKSAFAYYRGLFATAHPRNIAQLAVVATATLLIVDYVFKLSARARYEGDALAAFFGTFYSATSISALFFQLFLVHVILKKSGVSTGLAILPAALFIAAAGAALTGGFGWVVAAKFVDSLFDFTVNAAALQLLYLGIRKQSRGRVRTLVEGTLRPTAIGLVGLALAVVGVIASTRFLSAAVAVLAVAWIVVAYRSYRSYVAGLLESIGARRFDLEDEPNGYHDKILETHFREALRSASDDEVPYLLGVISGMGDVEWTDEYRTLLQRASPSIRANAIDYLRTHGNTEDLPAMLACLDDPDPVLRRAAVLAIAKVGGTQYGDTLLPLVDDEDPYVRAAATAEVIRIGDIDALLGACVSLKLMLSAPDERLRAAGADALAMIEHDGLAKPLSMLLGDPNAQVRLAALQACGARRNHELIPQIATMIGDPEVGWAASDALVAYGAELLPHARDLLRDAESKDVTPELMRLPAVLARTGEAEALNMLLPLLAARSNELRSHAAAAYCDLASKIGVPRAHVPALNAAAVREVEEARQRAALERQLYAREGSALICRALREEHDLHLRNTLLLLEAQHPQINARSILFSLNEQGGDRRAEAIEVLDNIAEERVKRPLLGLLETIQEVGTAEALESQLPRLLDATTPEWLAAGAAFLGAESLMRSTLPGVKMLLLHPSPPVRETALYALSRLGAPSDVSEACAGMVDDPDLNVRRLAASLTVKVSAEAVS